MQLIAVILACIFFVEVSSASVKKVKDAKYINNAKYLTLAKQNDSLDFKAPTPLTPMTSYIFTINNSPAYKEIGVEFYPASNTTELSNQLLHLACELVDSDLCSGKLADANTTYKMTNKRSSPQELILATDAENFFFFLKDKFQSFSLVSTLRRRNTSFDDISMKMIGAVPINVISQAMPAPAQQDNISVFSGNELYSLLEGETIEIIFKVEDDGSLNFCDISKWNEYNETGNNINMHIKFNKDENAMTHDVYRNGTWRQDRSTMTEFDKVKGFHLHMSFYNGPDALVVKMLDQHFVYKHPVPTERNTLYKTFYAKNMKIYTYMKKK